MRIERVVLETTRYRIVGNLTLPSEGYRSRLSDFLNRGDVAFIPITDAAITTLGTNDAKNLSDAENLSFIAVARDHVQIAYPSAD